MLRRLVVGGTLAVLAWSTPSQGQTASMGLSASGTGLISLPDTRTQPPGTVTVGIGVDNQDRDPLGVDLFDGTAFWSLGLTDRVETYGHYVFSRVASTPPGFRPPPPPPFDLIVPDGATVPSRPYYPLEPDVPYLDSLTSARFSDFIPGDVMLGAKARLRNGSGLQPAAAFAGDVTFPLSHSYENLRSGSGTGSPSLRGQIILEWQIRDLALVVQSGYMWTAAGGEPDRILESGPVGGTAVEEALELPDRLLLGLGARWQLSRPLAAITELVTQRYVGSHTMTADLISPVDLLAGLQLALGRASVTAGLRYNASAPESPATRSSPMAGSVVLTDVSPQDAADYLERMNLGDVVGLLRPHSQILLVQPDAAALPSGAWIVPPEYAFESEHQVGFLLIVGWRFAGWSL